MQASNPTEISIMYSVSSHLCMFCISFRQRLVYTVIDLGSYSCMVLAWYSNQHAQDAALLTDQHDQNRSGILCVFSGCFLHKCMLSHSGLGL